MVEDIIEKTLETIQKYKLFNKEDKIVVALSGGKDSSTLAYILKKLGYDIKGLYVDLCVGQYSKDCLDKINELCEMLDIDLYIYNISESEGKTMKDYWALNEKLNHCAACGVVKKWSLNKIARELGFDKIATGHNMEDEVQTFLINVFKGSPELSAGTGPVSKEINEKDSGKFVSRVKPFYYIHEKDIKEFADKNKLSYISGKCPFAQESYRIEVRDFLETLDKKKIENIMDNFLDLSLNIKKIKAFGEMRFCEICGEPSQGKICKRCKLVGKTEKD